MSCVEGWWNFNDDVPGYQDEIWIYYADAEDCTTQDVELESCGGSRGLLAQEDSGGLEAVIPCTNNPFYQIEYSGLIQVRADINIKVCVSDFLNVAMYAHDEPFFSGSGHGVLVGVGSLAKLLNQCQEVTIPVSSFSAMQVLKEAPYVYFKVSSSMVPMLLPPDPESLPLDAVCVMDNVTACASLEYEVITKNCGEICLVVEETACPLGCNQGDLQGEGASGCELNIHWFVDGEFVAEAGCQYAYIGAVECCYQPEGLGEFYAVIEVTHFVSGQEQHDEEFILIDYDPCKEVEIQGMETWDSESIPSYQFFELITVPSGTKLTIEADLELKFCESGKLVIEPGGLLELYGTLTAGCDAGWLGVEVQGNGSASQFPLNGAYPQGRLICHPGSVIEHAAIGMQLFGPTRADAGGQLQAEGVSFRNNSRAIEFAAYHNYFVTPAKQRPYFSKIRDCAFVWNDDYQIGMPTRQHIKMDGVFGVGIYGCAFSNTRNLTPTYNPKEYGVGISSTDSHFIVGSSSTPSTEPCPMPCAEINSTFSGLGTGIAVARVMRNMPFAVYSSRFDEVFFGIMVSGVHGADIMHNEFKYGQVQPISGDRDQVGIYFVSPQHFGSVQENTFERTAGNAGRAYGIVCNETGPYANGIRKNSFDSMYIANQAFRSNAAGNNFEDPGLRYQCNLNNNPNGRDFHVAEVEGNGMDRIQAFQGEFPEADVLLSAANTFSEEAVDGDGHFGNYGAFEVNYYFDPNASGEEPDDEKIVNIRKRFAIMNTCGEKLCDGLPCIGDGALADVKSDFAAHSDSLAAALNVSDTIGVVYHKDRQLDALRTILRRYEVDTTGVVTDSLLNWYNEGPKVYSYLLALGMLAYADSTTYVLNRLYAMSQDTTLIDAEREDARRIRLLYSAISTKSIDQFDSDEVDSLLMYARIGGAAMGVSHGLLMMSDTFVSPMYLVPGELSPRADIGRALGRTPGIRPVIYPNPTAGSIFVLPPNNKVISVDRIDVLDGLGRIILSHNVTDGDVWPVEVRLPDRASGIFVVRMSEAGEVVASGLFSKF